MALTRGTDGTPVEKYAYSPFGEQRIFVDLTKPRIEQLRREGDRLLLEVSERIQLAALVVAQASGDLTLTHTGTGQTIEVEVTLPVLAGRTGAKRIAIRPTAALEEGAHLRLHLAPGAILDRFQNPLAGAYDRDLAWSAQGEQVIEDTAPPQLDLVVVHENVLTVGFTEAIAAEQTTAAITVDGNPVTWTSDESGYTLHTEPLANGVHRIEIEATLADLAGTPLGEVFTRTVELTPTGALLYVRPDPREVSSSAASNPYCFQGLQKDPETGFVYARNRYYDPEMGRFVSADPLGYVDGGNLYQYGLNDPVNNKDPLGLCVGEYLSGTAFCKAASDYIEHNVLGVDEQAAQDHGDSQRLLATFQRQHGRPPHSDEQVFDDPANGRWLRGSGQWVSTSGEARPDATAFVVATAVVTGGQAALAARAGGATLASAGRAGVASFADEVAGEVVGVSPSAVASTRWLRGTAGNAGPVPDSVAVALRRQTFSSRKEFREALWRTVADDPGLAAQFSASNISRMRKGLAPRVVPSQRLGGQGSYILRHRTPVSRGGAPYDPDNILVVTPRYHKEVLEPAYHYGGEK